MTSVQKNTTEQGQRSPRKSTPLAERDPFDVAFGERLREASVAKGMMTSYALAGAIGQRWGVTRPTTRVSQYFNGIKLPRVGALKDLCDILGASADWLLYGDGPLWRDGQRPPSDWLTDFAADLQRRLCEGLKSRPHGDRYAALRYEHLTVDPAALLARTAEDLTAEFHRDTDNLLDASLKARLSERQADLIVQLTEAHFADKPMRAEGMAAARSLSLDAEHLIPDPGGPITLTDAGVSALLERRESADGAEAARTHGQFTLTPAGLSAVAAGIPGRQGADNDDAARTLSQCLAISALQAPLDRSE